MILNPFDPAWISHFRPWMNVQVSLRITKQKLINVQKLMFVIPAHVGQVGSVCHSGDIRYSLLRQSAQTLAEETEALQFL